MLNDNHIEPKQADTLPCGFPAGTRITTDKGLKSIEDIQVGDMVLSKPDTGIGEQSFKPVVRTFVNHQQEIYRLTYAIVNASVEANSLKHKAIHSLSRKGNDYTIRATPNHPFWVKGQGWTSLKQLRHGQLLEMKDSQQSAYVILVVPEYQTNHPNISASYGFENVISYGDRDIDDDKDPRYTFNLYDNDGKLEKLLLNGDNRTSPVKIENFGQIYATNKTMLNTVYNFEVADNHTCYIFDKIWVHE